MPDALPTTGAAFIDQAIEKAEQGLLRGAAKVLRERATMHPPGVGLALADWLDAQHRHVTRHECEAQCEYPDGCDQTRIAYRIADLILGADETRS